MMDTFYWLLQEAMIYLLIWSLLVNLKRYFTGKD